MKIYMAGPGVFKRLSADEINAMKSTVRAAGADPLYPADAGIKKSPHEFKHQMARRIREADLSMIRECDGVVADVSRFRGPSADPGTVYEIGYAEALGKPVVQYISLPYRAVEYKLSYLNAGIPDGWDVENFGLTDNLMFGQLPRDIMPSLQAAVDRLVTILKGDADEDRSDSKIPV